ncbi:GAF domain-containing protein, partial [Algibacter sp.]|uniref:GAF domain-containing protein n=1 Tax=Algibacter sp. TaxID=1872428 RepID=UPI003C75C7BB
MDINDRIESPMMLKVGFSKLLGHYEELANSDDDFLSANAKRILKAVEPYPELRDGFSNVQVLKDREKEISIILQDSFAPILTKNEIKTASVPFHDLIFNSSERFKNIIKTAGDDFELHIRNMPEDDRYIIACTIILNFCYGYNLNFKRPFYYEIPDENGILHYYKILYNADFCEIIPTNEAKKITKEDYEELLDNFENIALWKEKFPPKSYVFKGFVISNIFDITADQSISNIKSTLIGENKRKSENFMEGFHEIFRSLLMIKDIKVGFSIYNKEEGVFERVYGAGIKSFLLGDRDSEKCSDALCAWSYNRLLNENKYFSVSDVDKMFEKAKGRAPHIISLYEQGIKSAIFAPITSDEGLMGIIEIVSNKPRVLNSVNANKLVDVMPFIISAVERSKNEEENLIEAIIQQECTSVHSSVKWRFKKEAKAFIKDEMRGLQPSFKKIAFENIYPLYGQIDIKGSSEARNKATQQDLILQLNSIKDIFQSISKSESLPIYEQYIYQINDYLVETENNFQVDSEQQISNFVKEDIDPVFKHLLSYKSIKDKIEVYYS